MTGAELRQIHTDHDLTSREILQRMNHELTKLWKSLDRRYRSRTRIPPDTLHVHDVAQVTRWESGERSIRALHSLALDLALAEHRVRSEGVQGLN